MSGQQIFMILFGFIVIGYFMLYIGGKNYLRREGFQSGGEAGAGSPSVGQLYPTPAPLLPKSTDPITQKPDSRVIMEELSKDPVAKGAIQSLDDYEYNYVFQNESDRQLSTALRNKLMSQRPMDWAGLPPSSAQFQAGLRESFQNASQTVPDHPKVFEAIDGSNMEPPDTETTEMMERKLLQTYKPPSAKEITSYNPDEKPPEELIKDIYDVKGLVPTVAHKEGTNVYEIIGVRKKDEKILYEDEEAPAAIGPVQGAGEATITVPATAYDTAAATDPFYNTGAGGQAAQGGAAGGGSRMGRWDYQAWTPGLERMFAPTNPTKNWY
jgi:hypothetical protein